MPFLYFRDSYGTKKYKTRRQTNAYMLLLCGYEYSPQIQYDLNFYGQVRRQMLYAHFRIEISNHMVEHSEGTLLSSNFYRQVRIEISNAHFRIEILNHMAQHSEGTLFGSNFYG